MKKERIVKTYAKGEVLAHEGDLDFGWFILLSGSVGVMKRKLQVGTFNEKGSVFGEISGILNHSRTASLVALEETSVVCINATVDELVHDHPDVAKKMLINLAERLAKTTEELWVSVHQRTENKKISSH